MAEELFVCGAEIAGRGEGIGEDSAVLWAASHAEEFVGTEEAGIRKGAFSLGEFLFGFAADELGERVLMDISEAGGRFDEEITGIDIAVVFDDEVIFTAGFEGAVGVEILQEGGEEGVE